MCQDGGVFQLYEETDIKAPWDLALCTSSSGCSFASFITNCNNKCSIFLSSVSLPNFQTLSEKKFVGTPKLAATLDRRMSHLGTWYLWLTSQMRQYYRINLYLGGLMLTRVVSVRVEVNYDTKLIFENQSWRIDVGKQTTYYGSEVSCYKNSTSNVDKETS